MKHTRTLHRLVETQVFRSRHAETVSPVVEVSEPETATPLAELPPSKGSLHVFPITLAVIFFVGIPAVSILHAPVSHAHVNPTHVDAPSTTTTMH